MVAACLQVRGLALAATGKADDAEAALRDSLAVRTRSLPPSHWLIASSQSVLGEHLLRHQHRYPEAEPLLLAGYEGLRARLGPGDPRTRAGLTRVVALYDAWGKRDKAQPYRTLLTP